MAGCWWAGGYDGSNYLDRVEIYDPVSNTWTVVGSLNAARAYQTATLLLNGQVLAAGGENGSTGVLNLAELYVPTQGFNEAWRPQLSTVTPAVLSGGQLSLSGSGFRGVSEASGGATNNSATNYPLVQCLRIDNDQVFWLRPDPAQNFSATAFVSAALSGLPDGHYRVTVFTNGIPSLSGITRFGPAPKPPAVITGALNLLLQD
jgi:hypothetical protein